jgi:WD40 repeat protein
MSLYPFGSRGHRLLLSGAGRSGCDARLWRVADELNAPAELQLAYTGHDDAVFTVRPHPDGRSSLATGGGQDDKTARWWDMPTGACLAVLPHRGSVRCVRYQSEHTLLTASLDKGVRLWDIRQDPDAGPVLCLKGHTAGVHALALAPDGQTLVSGAGSSENAARLWDLRRSECVASLVGHRGAVSSLIYRPADRLVITGAANLMHYG